MSPLLCKDCISKMTGVIAVAQRVWLVECSGCGQKVISAFEAVPVQGSWDPFASEER